MNFQKLLPPVWFLLSIIVMTGLHFWLPVKQLFFPPITYLGIVAITQCLAERDRHRNRHSFIL